MARSGIEHSGMNRIATAFLAGRKPGVPGFSLIIKSEGRKALRITDETITVADKPVFLRVYNVAEDKLDDFLERAVLDTPLYAPDKFKGLQTNAQREKDKIMRIKIVPEYLSKRQKGNILMVSYDYFYRAFINNITDLTDSAAIERADIIGPNI